MINDLLSTELRSLRRCIAAGAVSAGVGVALGAFGAHGLRSYLPPEMLTIFETGVRYQMYHAGGLMLAGLAGSAHRSDRRRPFLAAGWAFGLGTLLFSGSLYLLALTGERWLGAIAPAGGVLFLAGWAALAFALLDRRSG